MRSLRRCFFSLALCLSAVNLSQPAMGDEPFLGEEIEPPVPQGENIIPPEREDSSNVKDPKNAGDASTDELIKGLGSNNPSVRRSSFDALLERGAPVRPQLKKAANSGRPAVAQAAAALLRKLPLGLPTDPPEVQKLLENYGSLSDDGRRVVLGKLITGPGPAGRAAGLRVIGEEARDSLIWTTIDAALPSDEWPPLLKDVDPQSCHPAVLLLKAKQFATQPSVVMDTLTKMFERELQNPTAPAEVLLKPVAYLAARKGTPAAYKKRAEYLRFVLRRSNNEDVDKEIIESLLTLQARRGPLPGVEKDLTAAVNRPSTRLCAWMTLAEYLRRDGNLFGARYVEQHALLTNCWSPAETADYQLLTTANFLLNLGQMETAEQALVALTDRPSTEGKEIRLQAFLSLHGIYARQRRHDEAANALEIIAAAPAAVVTISRPDGVTEAWSPADIRETIAWNRWRAAKQAADADAASKKLDDLLFLNPTESNIYLDVLPDLEKQRPAEVVDAYFDRVYDRQQKMLTSARNKANALNEIAWVCARSNRQLKASEAFAGQAVSLEPENAAFIDTQAEIQFRLGRIDKAIELEERAKKIAPQMTFIDEQLKRFRAAAETQPSTTRPAPDNK